MMRIVIDGDMNPLVCNHAICTISLLKINAVCISEPIVFVVFYSYILMYIFTYIMVLNLTLYYMSSYQWAPYTSADAYLLRQTW
jgi:hypothetical protein